MLCRHPEVGPIAPILQPIRKADSDRAIFGALRVPFHVMRQIVTNTSAWHKLLIYCVARNHDMHVLVRLQRNIIHLRRFSRLLYSAQGEILPVLYYIQHFRHQPHRNFNAKFDRLSVACAVSIRKGTRRINVAAGAVPGLLCIVPSYVRRIDNDVKDISIYGLALSPPPFSPTTLRATFP
ncbi:hypothetical protein BC936DRAFT_141617 [Jimgerdemannia flammicorona]|uniref:Uncharacterized protein n=1 Tax=Jimgerdemannia flammicorona TaxID=994334 RepID=A0A433DFX4_9FUNG|nr:hypothetical protein BC936DRAFT_141617 [Jimgerdemannia flammicorona]